MALPLSTQPRDLLLNSSNDIVIGTDLSLSSGVQAIVQSCRIALQMFAGEWFLDLDLGIPYWQSILAAKPAPAEKAAYIAFRSALLAVSGVISIVSLNVTFVGATRTMDVTFSVQCAFGDTPEDSLSLAMSGGNAIQLASGAA